MVAVLGYGSLIRPSSIAERHNPSWTQAAYDQNDILIHPDARQQWQEIRDRITALPVRIHGHGRLYSFPSQRGGTMLELYPGNDTVNGIIYTGLTDDEHDAIAAYEDSYRTATLTRDSFDPYPVQGLDEHQIPRQVTVYLPSGQEPRPDDIPRKNAIYHRRILHGIEHELAELYTDTLARRFRADFLTSTQEVQDGSWHYLA